MKYYNSDMKSKLEREWWFSIPVILLATFASAYLFKAAGWSWPTSVAGCAIYVLCVGALHQGFSFLAWMLVALLAPAHKVRELTR